MGYRLNFLKDSSKKLGNTIRIVAVQAGKSIAKVAKKVIIAGIIILVVYIILIIVMNASYCKLLKGTCIEADEFGGKTNAINAKPLDENQYTLKNDYKHNEFTQKVVPTDLNMTLNGDPIIINITGEWIPWFGDLSQSHFNTYKPDSNFICAVEKYTISNIGGQSLKFSNKEEENEFYYIRNYYAGIKTPTKDPKNNMTIIEGIEEPPERQKECWLAGGVGLYMASFGLNGRTEPTAYHHLKADKLICNKAHWFNGKALKGDSLNRNYVITKYGEGNSKNYKMSDFITNYFSVSYYSDPDGYIQNYSNSKWKSEESEYDKDILVETENQIIYNIGVHEKKLEERLREHRDNNVEINEFRKNISYGFIVSNSITKFMQACYQISKSMDGEESRSYRSYFQYGPKTLYKNMQNVQNIKYEYGEMIKMLILDKFYENNSGFYRIEIISGIEFDDADLIEQKIKEVEFYLLGTPNKEGKRSDGMVARIFNNVLSSSFALFAKTVLMLYVVYYGYRVIFGFKKDRNDKSVVNNKDLMITLVKFVVVAIFLTPAAFSFFSELILSSVIDGTIGIIDMIAGVFSNNFNDNAIALTGGLKYANEIKSLSRNFAIVDEILNFFTNKVILSKVLGFAFNFTQTFGAGLIISIGILLVLLFYVYKLVQSIVPFIFVLLQFTLALPLAPLFILFVLFKETSYIFQNWVKFILSKSLELIGFFTAFYFCTSIINNFIKQLLNYKVCFKGLGDKLFPDVDDKIGVSSFNDFIRGNWFFELIKKILNNFLAVSIEGLPDNYFIHYVINILITAALIFMFDTLLREVMNIINSILTIDGATANSGGKNAMAAAASGEFSIDNQFKEFGKNMGLAAIQNESDLLKGTKKVFDLEKGVTRNVLDLGKKLTMPLKAGVQALSGDTEGAKQSLAKAADLLAPFTAVPIAGDKVQGLLDNVEIYKDRAKKNSEWSDTLERIKGVWSDDKNKSETNVLLSKTTDKDFKKQLKTMDKYTVEKIFGKEMAEKIFKEEKNDNGKKEYKIITSKIDELDSKQIGNLRNYLTRYQANEYMKAGMEDLNYDIFSDNYGESNEDLLKKATNSGDKESILEVLKNTKKKTVANLFGKENADRLKKTVAKNIKDYKGKDYKGPNYKIYEIEDIEELDDYVVENMKKHLTDPNLRRNKNINRDITSKSYGAENSVIEKTDELKGIKNDDELKNKLKEGLKDENKEELAKILGNDNVDKLKEKIDRKGDLSKEDLDNVKKHLKDFEDNGHKELEGDGINRDVTSEDYGREDKFVAIDNVLLNENKRKGLENFVKNNRELAEGLLEKDKVEAIIEKKTVSDDDINKMLDTLKSKSQEEVKVELDGEDTNVLLGENEYKIGFADEDGDGYKKGDPAAIFDQDGTKIFEVKDAGYVIKVDGIEYIVTSTKEGGVIINICKEDGTKGEKITKEEKNAELQARIEKKMQKYNKIMEEVKKINNDK